MKNNSVIGWFIGNPIAANFLMFLLLISGLISVFNIAKQYEPEKKQDKILVSAEYPGAIPRDVEDSIVIKIEENTKYIEGIKKIESSSSFAKGSVLLHLESSGDMDKVLSEVRAQVNTISTFPTQVENLIVEAIKNWRRLMFVQIYGDADSHTIKEITKEIRDEISLLGGISKVHIPWIEKYEISIDVSLEKVKKYNITLDEVAKKIQAASKNIGGGLLRSQSGDLKVYSDNKAHDIVDFENVNIIKLNGHTVKLKDIAKVRDTFEEKGSFFGFNGFGGEAIAIDSIGNQNDLAVSKKVYEYLEVKRKSLPEGIKIEVWSDNSYYLSGRLMLLIENIVFGSLLIFIFICLFLNVKLAFWVVFGVVTTISGVLALMPMDIFNNVTLNMFSLFAFILVIGIVVDDAVIIGEGAYQECEKDKKSQPHTIYNGVKKVATPALFGVITTMLAFSPLIFINGESSGMWNTIGIVAVLCLILSLVESKLILPSHLVGMKIDVKNPSYLNKKLNEVSFNYYPRLLRYCIEYRAFVLVLFGSVFFALYSYVSAGHIKVELWPKMPSDYIQVEINGNEGLPNSDTHKIVKHIIKKLDVLEQEVLSETGTEIVKHHLYWRQGDSGAGIFVELVKSEDRLITTNEVISRWREKIGRPAGMKNISIDQASSSSGPNLSVVFSASNPDEILQATQAIKQHLLKAKGVVEVFDSSHGGTEQLEIVLLPQGEYLGLTVTEVAEQVRHGVYGIEINRIIKNSEDTKVMLRHPKNERSEASDIDSFLIKTKSGELVPFSQVANYYFQSSVSLIQRFNGMNSITVHVYTDEKVLTTNELEGVIDDFYKQDILQIFPGVKIGLTGTSLEAKETANQIYTYFIIVAVLIYGALAIPLRSYLKPILILFIIPVSFFGALLGHIVVGIPISILSFMGCMALSGVVVNDSLVLMHLIFKEGTPSDESIVESCASRFRPIFINSFTTFLGLLPLLMESDPQSQFIAPMAVSLSFGVLLSSTITLVLIPIIVSFKYRKNKLLPLIIRKIYA